MPVRARRFALVALALGIGGAPVAGGAQGAAVTGASGAVGVVRGTVVDSLRGGRLAGAALIVAGTARSTVTDSAGRFVLDSVPAGAHVVTATHPTLDAVGIDEIAAAVTVVAGAPSEVVVATPSRRTLWARLCGGAPPADSVGALFGEVRDARSGTLVAGARTTVAWTGVDRAGRRLDVARRAVSVVSDTVGTYRLCGVPAGAELALDAAAGPLDSARAVVTLDGAPFARVDLWVRGAPAVATAPGATPPVTTPAATTPAVTTAAVGVVGDATAVLTGVVRDSLGAPRSGARITVDGAGALEAVSDADGRFRLGGLPSGTRPVTVRAVGYTPQVVNATLRPGHEAELAVSLSRAVTLAEVSVRARATAHRAFVDELYRRQRIGLTTLMDTTLLHRTGQLRVALGDLPFARVQGTLADWRVVFTNGGAPCVANVFIDGQRVDWEVAQALSPELIAAAEVYRRPGTLPAQYASMVPNTCGAVLLWTRSAR